LTSHLQLLTDIISDAFPDHWWDKYDFDNASITIDDLGRHIDRFKEDMESIREKVFDELNLSVFKGEYICDDTFEGQVAKAGDALTAIPTPFPPIPDAQKAVTGELNTNFIECIRQSLGLYRTFYTSVKLKITFSSKYFLPDFDPGLDEQVFEWDIFNDNTFRYFHFFSGNLKIARLDIFLEPNQDDLNRLFSYSQELQNGILSGHKFSKLLLDKCNYLINKWVLRKRHYNERPIYWVRNYQEEEFAIAAGESYKKWLKYIGCHYEMNSEWRSIIEEGCDGVKEKKHDGLTLFEIHLLIKFYKDVNKNLTLLTGIKKQLAELYEASKEKGSLFDLYSYSICVNYAANNEFSLLLEDLDVSEDKVEKAYNELLEIQARTGVNDFFPQYKFLCHLVEQLSSKYNNREAVPNISHLRALIDKCKRILEKYEENIEWSKSHYNYVWQMPYRDCQMKIETSSGPDTMFVASTFVLPLIQKAYIDQFDELKKKVFNFETSIEAIENLDRELKKIDGLEDAYKKLEKDVERNFSEKETQLREKEVKYIETIGIFAAIVTFVATSISGYKFVSNANQAALFTISLCTSFCFFAFLLMIIFKGYEKYKKTLWYFIGILIITAISWYLLCHSGKI